MYRGLALFGLLFIAIGVVSLPIPAVNAQPHSLPLYSLQIGAWGDTASTGNTGVRLEIQTNTYNVPSGDGDAFWAANHLRNGAIVQFGYIMRPGYTCLQGTIQAGLSQWAETAELNGPISNCAGAYDKIRQDDPRWFWEYFPPISFGPSVTTENFTYYYEIGPVDSAGQNGTWHEYSIQPNSTGYWVLVLDRKSVAELPFKVNSAYSAYYPPVSVVAEKVTEQPSSRRLGPVGFRNLQYLKSKAWQSASYLSAYIGWGCSEFSTLSGCKGNWWQNATNPYGVAALGANSVIAGSGIPQPQQGVILWAGKPTVTILIPSGYSSMEVFNSLFGKSYTTYGQETPSGQSFLINQEVQLILANGTIALPSTLPVYSYEAFPGVRMQFEGWSDGFESPNRTLALNSNPMLKVTYVPQYKLDVISPDVNVTPSGVGWYNAGTTATFSVPNTAAAEGWWGHLGVVYHFQGWYREPFHETAGNILSYSSEGRLVLNHGPCALFAKWSGPDYTVPIVGMASLVGAIIISLVVYCRRVKNAVQYRRTYLRALP